MERLRQWSTRAKGMGWSRDCLGPVHSLDIKTDGITAQRVLQSDLSLISFMTNLHKASVSAEPEL